MNNNETRTLWISIGAALFAVFLLYSYTNERSYELAKKFGTQKTVVIASKNINEMETIDESMLETTAQPAEYVQPDALSDVNDAVGLVALAPIKAHEQILQNKIMKPGAVTGLSLQVSPGKRAVTLPVDEMRGVAKLLKPGDHIDILAALEVGHPPTQHREVKTILQDVTVLATGLNVVNELPRLYEHNGKEDFVRNIRADTSFTTITVESSPSDSQNLIYILATSPGSLFLTLRHPTDHTPIILTDTTIESVLGKVDASILSDTIRAPASTVPMAPAAVKPAAPVTNKPKHKKGGFVDL
jgi:pilus assembly protein CpaB